MLGAAVANLLLGSPCPCSSWLWAVCCTCGAVLAQEDTQHSPIPLEQPQKSLTATSLGAVTRIFNSPLCSMRSFQPGWLCCDAKESQTALFFLSADVILHQIQSVIALMAEQGLGVKALMSSAAPECCELTVTLWKLLSFCSSNNLFII